MDIASGLARPKSYYFDEDELEENVRAAEVCPAKKDRGVIHVIDRRRRGNLPGSERRRVTLLRLVAQFLQRPLYAHFSELGTSDTRNST